MYEKAINDIKNGKPVLIFDNPEREGETDIVFASQFVDHEKVRFMRTYGGGLICTTLTERDARRVGLPYIEDVYRNYLKLNPKAFDNSDLRYDKNSSFSVTINDRRTFTGIPDNDRSLTITSFANFLSNVNKYNGTAGDIFSDTFRIPGHVILIIARDGYFLKRRGHTELSTYLMETAGLIPSATIVEMLDTDGYSMKKTKAEAFAKEHGLTFIEGDTIIAKWKDDQNNGNGGI